MISYTDKEIEKDRLDRLNESLAALAEVQIMELNNFEPLADDSLDLSVNEFTEANKENLNAEFTRNCQPGSYACHEILEDSSNIMNDIHILLDKDSIIANPEWFKMVHQAGTLIFNLYQEIGAVHLDAIPENIVELVEAQVEKNKNKGE